MSDLPQTAYAVQLTGAGQLRVNRAKAVPRPGPHQVLCRVEAVGLCFSDLKLLKQFADHPRKGAVRSGIEPKVLGEIPSYMPDQMPTVPGHEAVVRVVAAGPGAAHRVGLRALVQTDYRWLPTNGSNASFGYNFEGGLQEYVLMDERVIVSPEGESLLIPVGEDLGASAVALIEPWACVEDAYVAPERRTALPGGRLLVVVEPGAACKDFAGCFAPGNPPSEVVIVGACPCGRKNIAGKVRETSALSDIEGQVFDDIIYFGANGETIARLDQMLAPRGLLNVVLGGRRIGKPVLMGVGRVHYGGMRFTGTTGDDPAEGLRAVPENGEIRPGEKILVVGAAGPMGLMHVVRDLCQGVPNVEIVGTDFDDARLAQLDAKAIPLAKANGVRYESINPSKDSRLLRGSYTLLMVPVPALVAKAVADSLERGVINIFAGLPATTSHEIDLDAYIAKRLYFIGTSGSVIRDMKIVLEKVQSGRLDTNISVAAVAGMAGAIDGIHAVENRTIPGKIIVYPQLRDLPLTPLEQLRTSHPKTYAQLRDGQWTREAERALLA
jgi:threonine dehydrogenase-like Zn-dependent dehydrogenase